MKSKTKFLVDDAMAVKLFESAGLKNINSISLLGDGEFNAVYQCESDGKWYVLKIAPDSNAPTLIYEKDMIKAEVYWYDMIRTNTDIKVPQVYYYDSSKKLVPTSYFVMEKLEGDNPSNMKMSAEEKHDFGSNLAVMCSKIHKVRGEKFGYIQNELHDDWYTAIRSMVVNLLEDAKAKGKRSKRGLKLLSYIDKHKAILQKVESRMVNFDLWMPNFIVKRDSNNKLNYAWIDPERSFWGDRIGDFVCLEMTKTLEKKKHSLTAYNKDNSDPIVLDYNANIRFAIMIGYLGLIIEVEKYYRYSPTMFGWWRNVIASKFNFNIAFKILKKDKYE